MNMKPESVALAIIAACIGLCIYDPLGVFALVAAMGLYGFALKEAPRKNLDRKELDELRSKVNQIMIKTGVMK